MKRSDKVRQAYPSDLTDAQWAVIEPLYSGMRTYKWSKRELTNAVLYFVKTGCQWRHLPARFSTLFDCAQFLPACPSEWAVGEDTAALGQNIPGESRAQSGAKLCDH
ncbi:transposase [Lawsonibacter hominis]|uniref:Transposase n=1 Tax=Lawsonibacter hominis TaxID=2763053 RepID=A0A8J6MAL2_9FIRM|nr:transposase [Lawsonibacter hominis]